MLRADEAAIGYVPHRTQALPVPLPATLVAFYLPQFHPFAENDAWWGKGFTEWRNVTRALPQFEGHIQPRLPADLGFYDLRNPQVMRDQARLASEYGIGAFCFYYYWFSGTTLMEAPLRQWLADDSIDLPFCLCWANENWARRWDGRDEDILIGQRHSAEDDLAFIAHVAGYLRDRRALKVDGKPMLLVYRPHLLPDARATADRWRQWCLDNGIGEIHLAYVQGFERPDPGDIGFDAAVEFPPNMSNPRSLTADQYLINPDFHGDVRDWRELATEIAARPLPAYTLYPGVNPGWDNEARRSSKGRVYLHASPRGYRDWLQATVHDRLAAVPPKQRLVFINAWNEWAEGAVLEPDARLGHAWLQATRQALSSCPSVTGLTAALLVLVNNEAMAAAAWNEARSRGIECRVLIPGAQRPLGAPAEIMAYGTTFLPQALAALEDLLHQGATVVRWWDGRNRADGATIFSDEAWNTGLELLCQQQRGGLVDLSAEQSVAPSIHHERWAVRLGLTGPVQTSAAPTDAWLRLEALRPLMDAHLYPSQLQDMMECTALCELLPSIIEHSGFERHSLLPGP